MGQVMKKVERALSYAAGINQYQDPGLEPDRREAAVLAVKRAIFKDNTRDVFKIDRELRELEWLSGFRYFNQTPQHKAAIAGLMEEMLSHGDTMGEFCGSR